MEEVSKEKETEPVSETQTEAEKQPEPETDNGNNKDSSQAVAPVTKRTKKDRSPAQIETTQRMLEARQKSRAGIPTVKQQRRNEKDKRLVELFDTYHNKIVDQIKTIQNEKIEAETKKKTHVEQVERAEETGVDSTRVESARVDTKKQKTEDRWSKFF